MRMTGTQFTRNLWRQVALASSAALYLVLILTGTAFASNVSISDQAGVLNQSQVRKAASSLRYPVAIYTVNGFSGSTQQFNQQATNALANHQNMIVIAMDTSKRYLYVTRGRDVPLTSTDTADARQAFANRFNGGDYTGATVSSLNSLQNSLAAQTTTRGGNTNNGNGFGVGTCLVGLLILGGLLFLVMRRRRMAGLAGGAGLGSGIGGLFNRQRATNTNYNQPYQSNYPPDGPNYNQPPNTYPSNSPGYGAGYGPGYPPQQQNQGVNPLAAGGLGAAAGGLLGYELGKNQSDRDKQDESFNNSGDQSNSNAAAAGSGGFFGTDANSGNNENTGGDDSGSFFGGNEDTDSGSGGYFGGSGGDTDSGSGGFFGGNEDNGNGSGGNF